MKYAYLLIALLFSQYANASSIDFAPSFYNYQFKDPNGSVAPTSGVNPMNLIFDTTMTASTRLITRISKLDFAIEPGVNEIGENVSGYQYTTIYLKKIRLSRSFKFWAGGGGSYTQANYNTRHTVDSDGYLINKYEDRTGNFFSALLEVKKYWALSKHWKVGAALDYDYALSDGFGGLLSIVQIGYEIGANDDH